MTIPRVRRRRGRSSPMLGPETPMPLLEIEDLPVEFPTPAACMHAVEGVSLTLEEGEVLGIVGESGSGKSVTMMALMGLIAYPGRVRAETLRFPGHDLLGSRDARAPPPGRQGHGDDLPGADHQPESLLHHRLPAGRDAAAASPLDARRRAGARDRAARSRSASRRRDSRLDDYPHQLSGGMNQRVMIAMAISCNPRLLIADEPTTALDVTIQAQILDLLRDLQKERGMALVLITHNMGVVGEMAQRVVVMYAGQVMEQRSAVGALRRTPASLHRGAAGRAARAQRRRAGSPRSPAWCRALLRPAERLPVRPRCAYATRAFAHGAPGIAAMARRPRALPLSAGRSGAAPASPRRSGRRDGEERHRERAGRRSEGPAQVYEIRRGLFREPAQTAGRGRRRPSPSSRARRWRWWANPAAASPRSRAW